MSATAYGTDGGPAYGTPKEVAHYLGISESTVRRKLASGDYRGVYAPKTKRWRVEWKSVQLPAPSVEPEPTPHERIVSLLPLVTDAEQLRHIAISALQAAG